MRTEFNHVDKCSLFKHYSKSRTYLVHKIIETFLRFLQSLSFLRKSWFSWTEKGQASSTPGCCIFHNFRKNLKLETVSFFVIKHFNLLFRIRAWESATTVNIWAYVKITGYLQWYWSNLLYLIILWLLNQRSILSQIRCSLRKIQD